MTEFEMLEREAMENGGEESLKALAEWYEAEGMRFWDGIGFCGKYEGREYCLVPIQEEAEDGDFETIGWEVKF